MTKLSKLGEVWSKWNAHEISGDDAMVQIHKLFPRATLVAWRKRCEETEKIIDIIKTDRKIDPKSAKEKLIK